MSEPVLRGSGLDAAEKLRGVACPWHFAGGWAIDLHLGRFRREHKDADIAISYTDQLTVSGHLANHTFEMVVDHKFIPWDGEILEPPMFQFFAVDANNEATEFLLEPRTEADWIYRRNPGVTMPLSRALLKTGDGVPYLHPAIVLLFKSKHVEPTDCQDFEDVWPSMSSLDKNWLGSAIGLADPIHPWLVRG